MILKLLLNTEMNILMDEYEYLTGEEILPSNQKEIIEQNKFTYSPSGKAVENKQKQLKIKEKNKLMLQKF